MNKHVVDGIPTDAPNVVIEDARVRKTIYTVVASTGLGLACVNAGYGVALVAGAVPEFPLWLAIANAVFPVLGAGIGYTASRNTSQ